MVAISGGSDSTALLMGLHQWLSARQPHCALLAATVDHQLRTGSAEEVSAVAALCEQQGIPHYAARWHHNGVHHGVQQKARMARYELLADLAATQHVDLVLTGHTLDDQLETIAMRQKRGQGRGEAGIAPASCYRRSIWFARPFLGVRREALRTYLQQREISWIDDPSNESDAFERIRVRKAGGTMVDDRAIEAAQQARRDECQHAADLVMTSTLVPKLEREHAMVSVNAVGHAGLPMALAAILSLVGEKAYFPNAGALAQAVEFIAAQTTSARQNNAKLTVHGCLLTHRDGLIEVQREERHCAGGYFGMDRLLPSFDLALVNALYRRLAEAPLPPLRFNDAPY